MERSSYLYCSEGGSDKEYHAHLCRRGEAWVVEYANGPRGRVGTRKLKTEQPVTLEAAQKVFDALVKSKLKGGYTEDTSGVTQSGVTNARGRVKSAHVQQKPKPIDAGADLQRMLDDPLVFMQEKANGERLSLEVMAGADDGAEFRLAGINKCNEYVPQIPGEWPALFNAAASRVSFSVLRDNAFPGASRTPRRSDAPVLMVDSERVGQTLCVFDLLELDGVNLRGLDFATRYHALVAVVDKLKLPFVQLLAAEHEPDAKRAMLERLRSQRREGAVFKPANCAYDVDGAALKHKFLESSSCIVLQRNQQRSVQLGLLDSSGSMVPVGNVTIGANHAVPEEGQVVEVQYLYYNPGGAFEQPVYLGERSDVVREECTLSQVQRLKPEESDQDPEFGREMPRHSCG